MLPCNAGVYSAFPTPVAYVNLGEAAEEMNAVLIKDALAERVKYHKTRSATGGWQSKVGMENVYPMYRVLSHLIHHELYSRLPYMGHNSKMSLDEFTLLYRTENLWANILETPGAFNQPHIHGSGDTLFSGVYYPTSGINPHTHQELSNEPLAPFPFRTCSPLPGDLVLFDPSASTKTLVSGETSVQFPFGGAPLIFTPRASSLIIFPNYLTHMVTPLDKPSLRISISFSFSKVG